MILAVVWKTHWRWTETSFADSGRSVITLPNLWSRPSLKTIQHICLVQQVAINPFLPYFQIHNMNIIFGGWNIDIEVKLTRASGTWVLFDSLELRKSVPKSAKIVRILAQDCIQLQLDKFFTLIKVLVFDYNMTIVYGRFFGSLLLHVFKKTAINRKKLW